MTEESDSGATRDVLRRLWGAAPMRRRGPKPALSVQAIVEAALSIADDHGLAGVSMNAVAGALGCTSMALYRHIDSKDELIALLVDLVAADMPNLPKELGWRDGLHAWTQRQIDGVLAHPWLLDVPLASTPLGPHRTRWIDQGLGVMRRLNLPLHEKGQILNLLSLYVLSESRLHVELQQLTDNPFVELGRSLPQLADPEDLPHVFALFSDPAAPEGDDAFGLELILDGIEARLRRRSHASSTDVSARGRDSSQRSR